MKKNFIITFIYILFILIVSIFVFNFGYKNNYANYAAMPVAKDGLLDLSAYDFTKKGLVKIKGEAEFYYNQLLTPDDFNDSLLIKKTGYINIDGIWNGYIVDKTPIKGMGYATYRLKLKVPKDQLYGFKIKEFDCAYNIWVNGNGPMSAGVVGKSKNKYKPSWKRNEIYIPSRNKELEIVLQVANFDHRKGGPEDPIMFGRGNDILKFKIKQIGVGYLLFGILIIMAIYHFVLFLYRPKDYSVGFFSLLNYTMTLRLLTTGEKIFLEIFPHAPWAFYIKVEYISYTLAVPAFLWFIYSLYKKEVKLTFVKIVTVIAVIFWFIILVTPPKIFSYTPIVYQIVVVISAIYILYALIVAMLKRREHSFILFGGYFFFFLVIINDLLYYNKFLNTSFLMPLGLFIMVFSQAFVLSKKSSKAYTDVEMLSSTLDKYNKELEEMVDERVQKIKQQKDEIEGQKEILINQAEELKQINDKLVNLDKFKDNMTHMIVHDLKNPLNVILNQTKDSMIRMAGKQMLYLVQNILDVQKYEETNMELSQDRNSIATLVQGAIEQVKVLIKKKNIELINKVDTSGRFAFDFSIMERVVINLLTNAITFVPPRGKIRLSYRLEGANIIIEIFNDGPHIPEKEKDFIFSKYTHTKGGKSFFNASTGLGLTFCKMAMDAHKGKIGFYNQKEGGVTFWLSLPVNNVEEGSFDQSMSFLKSRNINQQVEPDLSNMLTVSDKLYLNTIKEELQELEIFEITKFKAALKQVNQSYSVGVYVWVESVQKSLQSIDEKRLKSLIDLLN